MRQKRGGRGGEMSMNIQERDKVEEEEEGLHEREIKREEKQMDTWKKKKISVQ